ncbi:MAG: UDP-N-acetylmuramate--L-alanine ligase [Planctomycetes bacterium]|nr:UDP-N-acetylmuramate--L-alanine ligase [Planctomycetota bacterium]
MRALAELLSDFGWTLTGSDQSEPDSALTIGGQQFRIHLGHAGSHVAANTDVLIFSPAVTKSNPERLAAEQLGIPQFSYSQFLGELMRQRTGIAVAGTHGKTTTTAILATILRESGLAPSAAIGGEVVQYGRSGWGGEGPLLVAESCEYRSHFLDHSPKFAAILGIEPDHFDCFPDWDSQLAAFREFAARVPEDGVLVIPAESAAATDAASSSEARIETTRVDLVPSPLGGEGTVFANWLARDIRKTQTGFGFKVEHNGSPYCEAELCVPGRHNIENALAAIALAHAAGAAADSIAKALPKFAGVRRRFEILTTEDGITVVDDYAHHPTAIRATLQTAREHFGDRRLLVAFQPHQISRTRELMDEFAASFAQVDELFLAPIFAARESSDAGEATLTEMANRVSGNGVSVRRLASLDRLKPTLDDAARPDDVVLILGAGNTSRIAHELAAGKIPGHHAG